MQKSYAMITTISNHQIPIHIKFYTRGTIEGAVKRIGVVYIRKHSIASYSANNTIYYHSNTMIHMIGDKDVIIVRDGDGYTIVKASI
jgi:hypothetical protein